MPDMIDTCTKQFRASSRWAVVQRWLRVTLGLRRHAHDQEAIDAVVEMTDYVRSLCGQLRMAHEGNALGHEFEGAKKAARRPVTA